MAFSTFEFGYNNLTKIRISLGVENVARLTFLSRKIIKISQNRNCSQTYKRKAFFREIMSKKQISEC